MTDLTPRSGPIQFRDAAVERELAARAEPGLSPGQVAARDLARYYRHLDLCRQSLWLDRNELLAVCDVANGMLWTVDTSPWIAGSVQDALKDGLAEKWKIDGPALIEKLGDMTRGQYIALLDAAEQFWALGQITDYDAALRQVGLLRDEED